MVLQPGKGNDGIQRHTKKGNWGDDTRETGLCTENPTAPGSLFYSRDDWGRVDRFSMVTGDHIKRESEWEMIIHKPLQYKLANDVTSWPI